MSKTLQTPAGTVLPLTNLKGKDYLMVAYRIQWMNEVTPNFEIVTEFPLVTDEQTIARAKVVLMDKDGKVVKSATATKRETKKDFSDHTEKAETAAIGRALAILGFGTQFAVADLDEGNRLADSPLETSKKQESKPAPEKTEAAVETPSEPKKASSSFKKPKAKVEVTPEVESEWS
jgi:hypothetical protein